MIEIRLHGRGGQGTVVAAQILAVAAGKDGKKSQSFSSFGAERRGAPVEGFVRIAAKPIHTHSHIYEPDIVVLMDASLIGTVNVLAGLKPGGTLLVNSTALPEQLQNLQPYKVALVDAASLARELHLGSPHSPVINTAMLGALAALDGLVTIGAIKEAIREHFPANWERNVEAAERANQSTKFMDGAAESLRGTASSATARKRPVPLFLDKSAPCREACPIGIDIEGAMRLVEEGKLDEAWELFLEENPFPAVTGRVCFHPCQTGCHRRQFDQRVSINAVERFLGDWGLAHGKAVAKPREHRDERVAVVGAGPAGLSCAYHLLRLGYSVVVFDSAPGPGGVLRYGIPPYRLPKDVLEKEIARLTALGADWHLGTKVGQDVDLRELLEYDAVFLATGAQRSRELDLSGEHLEGVITGISFLNALNSGRPSNDALADGKRVVVIGGGKRVVVIGGGKRVVVIGGGKRVVVIGGGNTAIDAARSALRLGADVTVLYRRRREDMPAHDQEVEEAEREGVRFEYLAVPQELRGEGGKVKAIRYLRKVSSGAGGQDRPATEASPGTECEVPADMVITAIGEAPDLAYLIEGIETRDEAVLATFAGQTAHTKVFAGGDLIQQSRTVAQAIGSGKRAAVAIDMALRGEIDEGKLLSLRIGAQGNISSRDYREQPRAPRMLEKVVGFQDLNLAYFTRSLPLGTAKEAVEERVKDFREVEHGLAAEQVAYEAGRCFHCGTCTRCDNCYIFCPDVAVQEDVETGRLIVQGDSCKACGICVLECPRGILSLDRVS